MGDQSIQVPAGQGETQQGEGAIREEAEAAVVAVEAAASLLMTTLPLQLAVCLPQQRRKGVGKGGNTFCSHLSSFSMLRRSTDLHNHAAKKSEQAGRAPRGRLE